VPLATAIDGLVEAGARVDNVLFAAAVGHVEIVRWLLAAGADPHARDSNYRSTAFGWALEGRRAEVIEVLRQHALPCWTDAIECGLVADARQHLERDPSQVDAPAGRGGLLLASAQRGNAEMVALLLALGADRTVRTRDGRPRSSGPAPVGTTPSSGCCRSEHPSAACMLGGMPLRLVCLSDTHGLHDQLDVPDGDVLLHAGDFTKRGAEHEVRAFATFLAAQPHRHKVVVAGNHDFLFERDATRARELLGDVTYLEDAAATIEGVSIWGSPWQPWFHDWAFNLRRGAPLAAVWDRIPDTTDLLITHGPPFGILDRTALGEHVGCEELVKALARARPRLHLFGHIHEAQGHLVEGSTLFVNASNCDLGYRPVQAPTIVDWDEDGPHVAHAR